jgi:hypothetical protein
VRTGPILAAAAVFAAVILGCGGGLIPTPPALTAVDPGRPGVQPVIVNVDDEGRYVAAIDRVNPADVGERFAVTNPGDDPRVLRVTWVGGACASTASITLRPNGNRIALTFTNRPRCLEQIGVPRAVNLHLSSLILAETVDAVDLDAPPDE